MCVEINAMAVRKVFFLMLYGIVAACPSGEEADCLVQFPVEGVAQFAGSVPATGSVRIEGESTCPPLIVTNPTALDNDDKMPYIEKDEHSTLYTENDDTYSKKRIPKEVIIGAILADVITAVKGAEINATLAELDAFIETELQKIGPLIESTVANVLSGIETQIATKLDVVDDFVESELEKTEKLVESITSIVKDNTKIETANLEKKDLEELELEMLELLVDSLLANRESVLDSELDKINSFVEAELAKVDAIVKAELEKVDLFVETELTNTDALVKSELAKMDLFVETELAKVKIPEESEEFCDVATGTETIKGSCDCPTLPNEDNENYDDMPDSYEPSVSYVDVCGTFPVSGRTVIIGRTGCPPLFPTGEPLPLYVESFPLPTTETCESHEPNFCLDEEVYSDVTPYDESVSNLPDVGQVFSGVTPAVGGCRIMRTFPCNHLVPLPNRDGVISLTIGPLNNIMQNAGSGPVSRLNILPAVNLLRSGVPADDQDPSEAFDGSMDFCGTTRATGSTRLFSHFPCPPLVPTQVGPNGKKYIWIAPTKPRPSKATPKYSADFPDTTITTNSSPKYSADCPDTSIITKPSPKYTADFPDTTITTNSSPKFSADCPDTSIITKPSAKYSADSPDTSIITKPSAQYSADIPDTTTTDSSCELVNEDLDFGVDGIVAGDACFEGTTPAYGSVRIRGQSN